MVELGSSYENVFSNCVGVDGNIYVSCVFGFKDELKKEGFKWDNDRKLWYISSNKLTKEIYDKTRKVRFANNTSIGVIKYYFVNYVYKKDIPIIPKKEIKCMF